MAKRDVIEVEGTVILKTENAMFVVELDNGFQLLAHISGKLRQRFVKILPGNRVLMELSPYDLSRGRIIELVTIKRNEYQHSEKFSKQRKLNRRR